MSSGLAPIITLDGPAGVGKTSLAVALSRLLDIPALDTGAMFRQLALMAEKEAGASPERIAELAASSDFDLAYKDGQSMLLCDGRPVGQEIRTEAIGQLASQIAANASVREIFLEKQREIGSRTPLVTEGRDMGTVVFPHAAFKFFLDADPHVRALRRYEQYRQKGQYPDLLALENKIRERDQQDRARAVAPLRPAEDAILVDTSNMDLNGVIKFIVEKLKQRDGARYFHGLKNS